MPTRRDIIGAVFEADPGGDINTSTARRIADAVLALLQPHTITTAEELDALPAGSIIRDSEGDACEKSEALSERWWVAGYMVSSPSQEVTLPATLLWSPEEAGQ